MEDSRTARDFPIVCVGGSAGGLDAYIRLLKHLPNDMGVAIVIVNPWSFRAGTFGARINRGVSVARAGFFIYGAGLRALRRRKISWRL